MLLDLEECDPKILNDLSKIKSLMTFAAKSAGATIVGDTFHKFSPIGVTGVISIAESHISIHTWPEHLYASVDIFSCGKKFDLEMSAKILIKGLSSSKPRKKIIERGISTTS
jgi:S-adenosylmethionine decarboxylase